MTCPQTYASPIGHGTAYKGDGGLIPHDSASRLLEVAKMRYPVTTDGHYLVVRGRLWRCTNPARPEDERRRRTSASNRKAFRSFMIRCCGVAHLFALA